MTKIHICHLKCLNWTYSLLIILACNTSVFIFPVLLPLPSQTPPSGSHANRFSEIIPVRWYGSYGNVSSQSVGGKRSSASGGMPKGRNKWVAALYIKRSSLVLTVQARLQRLAIAPISKAEGPKTAKRDLDAHQGNVRNPAFGSAKQKNLRRTSKFSIFKVIKNTAYPSLSASHHPHIGATVHHGDQHGHPACPFAAAGDGGVPPVSGYSLCLQGRAPGAPPPLRTVWHHWGGGGGLLQSGGGPGPEVVLADRGEPEEEHQMSPFIIWARARWIRLGRSQSGDQRTPSLSWMQTDDAVPDSKSWARLALTEGTIHD